MLSPNDCLDSYTNQQFLKLKQDLDSKNFFVAYILFYVGILIEPNVIRHLNQTISNFSDASNFSASICLRPQIHPPSTNSINDNGSIQVMLFSLSEMTFCVALEEGAFAAQSGGKKLHICTLS